MARSRGGLSGGAPLTPTRNPDPARVLSHLAVAALAGWVVSRMKLAGPGAVVVGSLVAAAAHERFDAPLAGLFASVV